MSLNIANIVGTSATRQINAMSIIQSLKGKIQFARRLRLKSFMMWCARRPWPKFFRNMFQNGFYRTLMRLACSREFPTLLLIWKKPQFQKTHKFVLNSNSGCHSSSLSGCCDCGAKRVLGKWRLIIGEWTNTRLESTGGGSSANARRSGSRSGFQCR